MSISWSRNLVANSYQDSHMAQHMYLLNQVCEHFVSLRTNVLGSSQLITDCCIADCSSVDALHKSVIIAINAKINVSLLRQLTAY